MKDLLKFEERIRKCMEEKKFLAERIENALNIVEEAGKSNLPERIRKHLKFRLINILEEIVAKKCSSENKIWYELYPYV